jgi:hypothetical protein
MTTTSQSSTLHPCFANFLDTSLKLRAAIEPKYGSTAADRASRLLLKITSGPEWWTYQHPEDDARFQAAVEELCSELVAEARAGVDRMSLRSQVHRRLDEASERIAGIQLAPIHQSEVKAFADAADRPEWPYRIVYDETRTIACIKLSDGKTLVVDADFVETLRHLWPWEVRGGKPVKYVSWLGWKNLKVLGGKWRPLACYVLDRRYARLNYADTRNAIRYRNQDSLDLRSENVFLSWEEASANVLGENRKFHVLLVDKNDIKQEQTIAEFVKTGEVPDDAEIKTHQIFSSKKLQRPYGRAGKVASSDELVEAFTQDETFAKPTAPVGNPDDLVDERVPNGERPTAPMKRWTGRVQRLFCGTCQSVQEVTAKSDDGDVRLECGHQRLIDAGKESES